jgi:cytidylate kinase
LRFDGGGRLWAGERDVSGLIRTLEMGEAASVVSALPGVRRLLVARQRELGAGTDIVMEGRDIGTNVFPDAEVKVFLTARPEVRAARRAAELREKGEGVRDREVLQALVERDRRDSQRAVAPLRKAPDAVEVDSSGLTLDEVVDTVVAVVGQKVPS